MSRYPPPAIIVRNLNREEDTCDGFDRAPIETH